MQKIVLALALAGALASAATGASAQVYGDTAKVLSAKPIYEKSAPLRDCSADPGAGYEKLQRPMAPDSGGPYRRISLQLAADAEASPVPPPAKSCGESKERIVGYDVRYEYNGREFRARMPYDPGKEMPVNVEVRPPVAPSAFGPRPPQYRGTY